MLCFSWFKKSLIAKTVDVSTLKMKTASTITSIIVSTITATHSNVSSCVSIGLNLAYFLHVQSNAKKKLRDQKFRCNEIKFVQAC